MYLCILNKYHKYLTPNVKYLYLTIIKNYGYLGSAVVEVMPPKYDLYEKQSLNT